MFFNKFFAISAVASLAAATAIERRTDEHHIDDCPGLQCCQTVTTTSDPAVTSLLSTLSITIPVQDLTAAVGLNCSPITVIGGSNGACSGQVVMCNGNAWGGLINIGCIPVTI